MHIDESIYTVIASNAYRIPERLKDVDSGYIVLYNRKRDKFEVHNSYQPDFDTYCFTVPFEELDARTIEYANRTHVRNKIRTKVIFKRLEEAVERRKTKEIKKTIAEAGYGGKEALEYLIHHPSKTDDDVLKDIKQSSLFKGVYEH